MEKIIKIAINQPSLIDDFKEHLKEANKPKTYNTNCFNNVYRSTNNTVPPSDDRSVYFYEYSDLTRSPLIFKKVSWFINWAKDHKIYMSSYTENQLRENETNYCTCFVGSATLLIRNSYELLKVAHNAYNDPYNSIRRGYDDYDYWD